MPADALATLGANAPAGMEVIPKAGIFCLQHHIDSDMGLLSYGTKTLPDWMRHYYQLKPQ